MQPLLPEIAVGGEGIVYRVAAPVDHVVKVYHAQVLAKKGVVLQAKLRAMVDNPPTNPTADQDHPSMVWPQVLVYDDGGSFAGYIMPFVHRASTVELHMVSNPADRKHGPMTPPWVAGFTWEYLLRVAMNLAVATQALHDTGYVIGDFNERNVLVHSNALVTLVDCDSFQVPRPTGKPFLCEVFRPEFTAPELLHVNLSREVRAPESDRFPLAVHIYQLLMEGRHPFSGIWHGRGEKPERQELAERGLFVELGDKALSPQAGTPPFDIFTDDVRRLFLRAFVDGSRDPSARPSGQEWYEKLDALATTLVTCHKHQSHRYPSHLGRHCPWCELEKHSTVATLPPSRPTRARAAAIPRRARQLALPRRRRTPRVVIGTTRSGGHGGTWSWPQSAQTPRRRATIWPYRRRGGRLGRGLLLAVGVVVLAAVVASIVTAARRHHTSASSDSSYLSGVAVDAAGDVYIADSERGEVLKISPSGAETLAAGKPALNTASLRTTTGIAVDAEDNLYIPDADTLGVHKVSASGAATTIKTPGSPRSGSYVIPTAVAVDASGQIYFSEAPDIESEKGGTVRKIDRSGNITDVAGGGDGTKAFFGDGGRGPEAVLDHPAGLAIDGRGDLYIADKGHARIRKLDPSGTITTVAGTDRTGNTGDGGPATQATLFEPVAIALDANGSLYIADQLANDVRKVDPSGIITTVLGAPSRAPGTYPPDVKTSLFEPQGVGLDASGNLYVVELHEVLKMDQAGAVTTVKKFNG